MVGTGHPEDIVPLHPLPPRKDVLERVVEGVAHVERAGNVGWGDDDREGRSDRVDVSVKQALFKPRVVPFGFRRGRVVDFRQGWDAHVVLRAGALLCPPG